MNKIVTIATAVTVTALGYLAATPYIVIHGMKSAAAARDGSTLSEYIDFPSVRQSLKDQLNAMLARNMAKDDSDGSPFAMAGAALASAMVDKLIDSRITPAGISQLMAGAELRSIDGEGHASETNGIVFADASMSHSGLNKFVVNAKGHNGMTGAFVFRRNGLASWKLTEIILPEEVTSEADAQSNDTPVTATTAGPVTAEVEAHCGGLAQVPAIGGAPFSEARQLVAESGWRPEAHPPADQLFGREHEFHTNGWTEVQSCSGTGLAPCLFAYRQVAGAARLEVTTVGEEDDPNVDGYRVDCQPEPERGRGDVDSTDGDNVAALDAGQGFTCSTEKHSIIITPDGDGFLYRSWNNPKSTDDEPDMVVSGGALSVAGTGPCRHREWSFSNGNVIYSVDTNINCTESTPPDDATGGLYVFVNDELKASYWCLGEASQ